MSRLPLPGPAPVMTNADIRNFGNGRGGFTDPMMSAPTTGSAGGAGTSMPFDTQAASPFMPGTPESVMSTSGEAVADAAKSGGFFGSDFWGEDGFNLGSIKDIAGTIGAFGNIWNGMKQNQLAQEALDFKKDAYETNMANQKKTFNLGLEDRIRARYAQQGRSAAAANDYINKHRM